MTTYILADGDSVKRYPYTLGMLYLDNPSTSFPLNMSGKELAEWGVFPVQTTAPDYDVFTETPEEVNPVRIDGVWRQSWTTRQATPEEIQHRKEAGANYIRFYDELLASPLYNNIRAQATKSLPLTLACTEFIAAFSDAKAGRPNLSAIQACINAILDQALLSNVDLLNLRGLMQDCGLLHLFVIPETV